MQMQIQRNRRLNILYSIMKKTDRLDSSIFCSNSFRTWLMLTEPQKKKKKKKISYGEEEEHDTKITTNTHSYSISTFQIIANLFIFTFSVISWAHCVCYLTYSFHSLFALHLPPPPFTIFYWHPKDEWDRISILIFFFIISREANIHFSIAAPQ